MATMAEILRASRPLPAAQGTGGGGRPPSALARKAAATQQARPLPARTAEPDALEGGVGGRGRRLPEPGMEPPRGLPAGARGPGTWNGCRLFDGVPGPSPEPWPADRWDLRLDPERDEMDALLLDMAGAGAAPAGWRRW